MQRRKGFTLIELLVVIAIIALLVSILLPSLQRAQELAKRTICKTRLSGVGKGLALYQAEFKKYPMHVNPLAVNNMYILCTEGDQSANMFVCPSDPAAPVGLIESDTVDDEGATSISYSYQKTLDPIPDLDGRLNGLRGMDGGLAIMADQVNLDLDTDVVETLSANHGENEMQNVLYIDSHVKQGESNCMGIAIGDVRDNIFTASGVNDIDEGGTTELEHQSPMDSFLVGPTEAQGDSI